MNRRGFTLVELLIVIAILAIVAALSVVSVHKAVEAAALATTNDNLRQCGIAVHSHNKDWKKVPPANRLHFFTKKTGTCFGHLLPYVGQKPAWEATNALGDLTIYVPVFQAPNDPTASITSGPVTSIGANGAVFGLGARNIDGSMPDGTSNTILFATVCQQCNGTANWATGARCVFGSQSTSGVLTVNTSLPSPNVTGISTCGTGPFCQFGSKGISICLGDHVVKVVTRKQQIAGWAAAMHPDDKYNPT